MFLFCLTPQRKAQRFFERFENFVHIWMPFLSDANQEICAGLKTGVLQKFENYRTRYRMCPSKIFISNPLSKILCHFAFRFFPHLKTPNNFIKYSISWKAYSLSASTEIPLLIWNPEVYWLLRANSSVSPIMYQLNPVHNPYIPLKPLFIHHITFPYTSNQSGFLTQLF